MKIIFSMLLLLINGVVCAQTLQIYGSSLELKEKCTIAIKYSSGKSDMLSLKIPSGECRLINYSDTNQLHLERIGNYYLFLVESVSGTGAECVANYKAIAIANTGSVQISEIAKQSGSCGADRDDKVFKYFAAKMGLTGK